VRQRAGAASAKDQGNAVETQRHTGAAYLPINATVQTCPTFDLLFGLSQRQTAGFTESLLKQPQSSVSSNLRDWRRCQPNPLETTFRVTNKPVSVVRRRQHVVEVTGWGGRIRTYGTRYQKALPYRLATPHQWRGFSPLAAGAQGLLGSFFQ
jgi:hypothetical protein